MTGIRSDYDILYPVLKKLEINKHQVMISVSGAHLSNYHSNTYQKIKSDGFKIVEKIDSLLSTDRIVQRAKGVGILIQGLAQTVERTDPDVLLVLGDREESIATAIVGNYMNKLVIHLAGGDTVYGNADDSVRFAVSKLAHVHCCFSKESAKNLANIGEEDFRIFFTGNPALTNIDNIPLIPKDEVLKRVGLSNSNYIVMIKHPLSSELDQTYNHISITLKALKSFCKKNNFQSICIYPNSDPGSFDIKKALSQYRNEDWFIETNTLNRKLFINLIRNARALIGNSSMGILEAPHYNLPVVNIGNRQKGRLNAGNVEFVDYNKNQIEEAITKASLNDKYREKVLTLSNPYGDGSAAKKVCEVIESIKLEDKKWLVKKESFLNE